jgi:prophage DNA circulation protein
MYKQDAAEAKPLIERTLTSLLAAVPTAGRIGADFRTTCSAVMAHAEVLLRTDTIGPPLDKCFDLARQAGATMRAIAGLRGTLYAETMQTIGATLMKNAMIHFCLATETAIIADLKFTSREDATQTKLEMNAAFAKAEESAADGMDSATYRALVKLHAATTFHLIETERPLPRMLAYRFAAPLPSLVMAYKLYDNASRCDELRIENKIIHPAFMRPTGVALSS